MTLILEHKQSQDKPIHLMSRLKKFKSYCPNTHIHRPTALPRPIKWSPINSL